MSTSGADDPRPPVVVGIDGSAAAISAAVWAVREAALRNAPLRLTYIVDSGHDESAAGLATAESGVRSSERPFSDSHSRVTIEVDIQRGIPAECLIRASRSAALVTSGHRYAKPCSTPNAR